MPVFTIFVFAAALAEQAVLQPASPTLQQEFDAASDLAATGECRKAVPLFEALERNPAVKAGSFVGAAIAVRKGRCLVRLGEAAEGEASIAAGLPRFEKAGPTFAVDIAESYLALGDAVLSRWRFADARRHYQKALALNVTPLKARILSGLARATTFESGPEAVRYADEGISLLAALPKQSKDALAIFHTLKGRALLNRGEIEPAYAVLKQALELSGGLTSRTTLDEAAMRGDLALAALLLGRKDEARRYLAYTGAGRIIESPFAAAVLMTPPACGGDTGLRPDDFAVVEFAIGDDGAARSIQTVYAKGGPGVAAAFAEAVSEWYWRPESVAKIPLFYRMATRVELRCSTAAGSSPGTLAPLMERFAGWATPLLQLPNDADLKREETLDLLRQKLSQAESDGEHARQVAATGLLALADPRTNAGTLATLDRALALPVSGHVPPEAVNALRVLRLLAAPYRRIRGKNDRPTRFDREQLRALSQDPVIVHDALAAASLKLLDKEAELTALQAVANDERLPPRHPLRQVAWLKLANRAASAGDLPAAQALFARTGLTEQQCALIGAAPSRRRTGADAGDFPQEAMRYGFEGWVKLEFDITADGRAASARPIVAYPPFVFVDAAKDMARGFRYESSYRPAGGVACSASMETIQFILPALRQ